MAIGNRTSDPDIWYTVGSIAPGGCLKLIGCLIELEQLQRLRSEDTPRRFMITHTIESYGIPSQKKTKSKLQI